MIRVLVADSHSQVRGGLSAFLRTFDDLEPVGQAADGGEVLKLCIELEPDVVLVDAHLIQMDGVTIARLVRQMNPHIQVVILSNYPDPQMKRQALEAGAAAFLQKDPAADDIVNAVRKAANRLNEKNQ